MAYFHFRLFLRPTVIGKAIIDRLSLEGADRQADARRWLELGYAAELAGFRLDGATISQVAHPLPADQIAAISLPTASVQAASPQPASVFALPQELGHAEMSSSDTTSPAPGPVAAIVSSPMPMVELAATDMPQSAAPVPVAPAPRAAQLSQAVDEMTSNLRGLSA